MCAIMDRELNVKCEHCGKLEVCECVANTMGSYTDPANWTMSHFVPTGRSYEESQRHAERMSEIYTMMALYRRKSFADSMWFPFVIYVGLALFFILLFLGFSL